MKLHPFLMVHAAVLAAADIALADPTADGLKSYDSNHDGRISLDEFYQTGPGPLHPRMKGLMLDSGAAIGDAILINERYQAEIRKLAADPDAKTYQAKELRVGDQLLATNQLCLLRPFEETVIGSVFFERHVITVDMATGKVWLQRNR